MRIAINLVLSALTLSSFVSVNADIIKQSDTKTQVFTPDFSGSWFTFLDETSQPKIRVKLIKKNVDATSWDAQGQTGYWLAVGFGTNGMVGSDIVMCSFKNTDQSTDKFECSDRKGTGHSLPGKDATSNVNDVDSVATFRTENGKKLVNFEATFERLLDTSDVAGDQILKLGTTGDAIFAHGKIINNNF